MQLEEVEEVEALTTRADHLVLQQEEDRLQLRESVAVVQERWTV